MGMPENEAQKLLNTKPKINIQNNEKTKQNNKI